MNTVHTLREYVDALRDAGILVESTVSDELAAREIHCLTYDTRALSEDALFICKGAHFKEEYLCDALSRGTIAYVAEKKHNVDAPCLLVNDIRYSLVVLGQLFYNHVTDKLTSVGITGTKGKSTTAYYVRYILNDWLRAQSMPECAILSSIDNYDGKSTEESHITTPEVLELYQHFENAYECGISHLVMEASSQALKYGRVRGITYDVAAFLNIGSDHISPIEHPDFEDYKCAKHRLFAEYNARTMVYNADDPYSDFMRDGFRGEQVSFGIKAEADYRGVMLAQYRNRMALGIDFVCRCAGQSTHVEVMSPGAFSASDALCAIAICGAFGVTPAQASATLAHTPVQGRFEVVQGLPGRTFIVDYSHNGLALTSALKTLRAYNPHRLICVFGSVGGRTQVRRKELADAAETYLVTQLERGFYTLDFYKSLLLT